MHTISLRSAQIDLTWEKKSVGQFFQQEFKWDLLSARSVWAFGPTTQGESHSVFACLDEDENTSHY